ncbi:MAG: ABC transporter ATP-binding protein [Candidatus Sumerlaeota bacterium]|nr:ABC transporter ATP-binding protein [Candidatus Sumerlaeota bacterium]
MKSPATNALEVSSLTVEFSSSEGSVRAVSDVDFEVRHGKTLALVGESGCGKSVTAMALLGMLPRNGRVVTGKALFRRKFSDICETDLLHDTAATASLRGREIAMVFQDPTGSLVPVYPVGEQVAAVLRHRAGMNATRARARTMELFAEVGIPAPARRVDEYPHQLSGGMCQRVMIAMAIACGPSLLIADEPTTALDVTIQAQVLELLKSMHTRHGMSLLLITHDMGIVADMAVDVAVMYLGRIVERGPAAAVFQDPRHPYTRGLFRCLPSRGKGHGSRLDAIPGSVPEPHRAPTGCPFRGRCPEEITACGEWPDTTDCGGGHTVTCWSAAADAPGAI